MTNDLFSKKEETTLLVDIGNGSIGVAIAVFSQQSIPRIIAGLRMPFAVPEKPLLRMDIVPLQKLLDEALDALLKNKKDTKNILPNPSSVVVSFSSPWFASKTKHLEIKEEKPFLITKTFLNQLTEKEKGLFEEELSSSQNTTEKNSIVCIEKTIIGAKVNGYTVTNLLGKEVKKLDAFLSLAVIDSPVFETVTKTIFKHTHVIKEKIIMHTFPVISCGVVRDIFPQSSEFMIMDVTGEVTDLSLIRDNVIKESISFPSGRNFTLRQIAKAFSVEITIAESMLHAYINKKSDEATSRRMDETLALCQKEWKIYYEDALSGIVASGIPTTVYLTADTDVSSIFLDFVKDSYANRIYLGNDLTSPFYQNDCRNFLDECIALLAIFSSKMFVS